MTENSPRALLALLLCCVLLVLAGCAGSGKRGGGYYQNDGPGSDIPPDIASIPDAVPRIEPYANATLRPYYVFGVRYEPIADGRPFRQTGIASWYGRQFHGNSTANGETYNMYAMTAAHPTLPIPSYARVTRAGSGRSVIVRINDRGPFHSSRIIDLSYAAAAKLGLIGPGSGQVIVEAITPEDIRTQAWRRPSDTPATSVATASPAPLPPPAPPPESRQVVSHDTTAGETPDALAALQASSSTTDNTAGAAPPEAASPINGVATQVYLQFGAFTSNQAAQSLAARLNQQLRAGEAGPAQVQLGQNNLYRVQIGPFASRTAAVNAAVAIQEQTGLQPAMALR
jgi:rare lipoprotein A